MNQQAGLPEFNRFVFDLYAAAYGRSGEEFHNHVFELLNRFIRIQSGWWGMTTGSDQKALVAKAALYNLPEKFLTEYSSLIGQDVLVDNLNQQIGKTLAYSGEIPDECPAMKAFDAKYQLHSSLSTTQADPASGVVLFISVFRNQTQPAFTENERALMELAMPHVVQAWSQNLRLAIANISYNRVTDTCFIDSDGRILDASPGFINALYGEFPEWPGGVLHDGLLDTLLVNPRGIYRGKGIDIWRVSAAGTDPVKIQCGRIQSSTLTPREAAVAAAFATGRSYKEIAITLDLSPATVRSYLQQCYSKLDVTNKIELGKALNNKPELYIN